MNPTSSTQNTALMPAAAAYRFIYRTESINSSLNQSSDSEHDHSPSSQSTLFHIGVHSVDISERSSGELHLHQSPRTEVQCLNHVLSRPDDRPADREAIEYQVDDGCLEATGR